MTLEIQIAFSRREHLSCFTIGRSSHLKIECNVSLGHDTYAVASIHLDVPFESRASRKRSSLSCSSFAPFDRIPVVSIVSVPP